MRPLGREGRHGVPFRARPAVEEMERILKPNEIALYLFTALHLQNSFPGHLLRNHPVGLNREKVDEFFLDAVCRLNDDDRFFAGVGERDSRRLHPYLMKYVVLFFDHSFFPERPWEEILRDYVNGPSFRNRTPAPGVSMDVREAVVVFEMTVEEYRGMTRSELAKCYRRKAGECHPDRGGEHEAFIRLSAAYEVLLERLEPGATHRPGDGQ